MKKFGLITAVLLVVLAGTAPAHSRRTAAAPAPGGQACKVAPPAMAPPAAPYENAAPPGKKAGAVNNLDLAVLALGALTALSLLTSVFFSIFRIPAGGWLARHKVFACITLGLMLVHGSLAFYAHFFG